MAVGVFPALKLGVLLLKQISKPLAKLIAQNAKAHPVFRTYFIMPPAQFYHWAETVGKMYMSNLGKPAKVQKLSEQQAIELGANLFGEIIIFTVAGGCLVFEYNRQSTKEAKKEAVRQEQVEKFTIEIKELQETTDKQEQDLEYLKNVVEEIAKKTKQKIDLDKLKSNRSQTTDNNNELISKSSEDKSVVHRAIVYYENDVKGSNKLS